VIHYRAKHQQWAEIEEWADDSTTSWDACILELRSRIEYLEVTNDDLQMQILRLSNAIANQLPNKSKFFADLLPD